jgi:hypothetical protein
MTSSKSGHRGFPAELELQQKSGESSDPPIIVRNLFQQDTNNYVLSTMMTRARFPFQGHV